MKGNYDMLNNLTKLKSYELFSISPENLTGEKGRGAMMTVEEGSQGSCARDLGTGWKTNPRMNIAPGETLVLADVKDQGEITQIWLTPTGNWRGQILRWGADSRC